LILDDRLPEVVPGAEFTVVESVDSIAALAHLRQQIVPFISLAVNPNVVP